MMEHAAIYMLSLALTLGLAAALGMLFKWTH